MQQFPPSIGKASEARGGNAMGIKGSDGPRVILEITGLWQNADDDTKMPRLAQEFTEKILKRLQELKKTGVAGASGAAFKYEEYNPLFMNDAAIDQDVFASYRDQRKFAAVQKSVDAKGFFSKRAGGFKHVAVNEASPNSSPKASPSANGTAKASMPMGHSHGTK
jgi:hypothetical protein